MATFRWRGNGAGTKTAWNDGRNWVNDAGSAYAQAVYPGATAGVNDDVIFDAALATGASSPAGYDATALVKLRSFTVGPLYNGTVGSAAAWLQIQTAECNINASAAGAIYLKGVSTDGLEYLNVEDGASLYFNGRIENANIMAGTSDFAASSTIATALTIGSSTTTTPTVTLGASMTLPATVYGNAGTVTCSSAITTLLIGACAWTQSLGDITTVRVNSSSGAFYHNGGNVTTAYAMAGLFDSSDSVVWRRIGDLYMYDAATVDLDDGVGSVVLTGAIHYYGGDLTPLANATIGPVLTTTYAGASDAKYGIAPQTINNSTATGDGVCLNLNDRLDIYVTCGAIAAGGAVTFTAYEDDASDFADEASLAAAGKTQAFTDADDNKTFKISIWGYELTAGKPWVRVKAVESGAQNALVSAVMIKHVG